MQPPTEGAMGMIPVFEEEDILRRVGDQSFQRGLNYFQRGAIVDPRRQGLSLQARCEGSRAEAYRVWATFDQQGLVRANCSCPVGAGGYCKHLAALLLTWQDQPDSFVEVEAVDAALERRSKDELIALVKQMLLRQPELEQLLETPLPVPGQRHVPVNPEVYRRQAAAAFRRLSYDYGSDNGVVAELASIVAIAEGFVDQGDAANAAVVYESVLNEIGESYEMYDDEGGELAEVAQACVAGLGHCLEQSTDAATRESALRLLFDVYHTDLVDGGYGLADGVPELILTKATSDEKRLVAGWLRDEIAVDPAGRSNRTRQSLGGLLLDLERDTLDDEDFLGICRETGRTHDLVDRLLGLGRVAEATTAAEKLVDHELLPLADTFVQHEHGDVAERLLAERARTSRDTSILGWLKRRHELRGDQTAALDLTERVFRIRPYLDGYQELRERASQLGRWKALRPSLHAFLQEAREGALLIRIYLDEGQIDLALDAVEAGWADGPPLTGGYLLATSLALVVAQAAEASRPRAALAIYQQRVERLIALRGRVSYQAACDLLKRVRAIHETLGETDAWTRYLADLREQNRNLRALKDELAAARLV
ncbi:MAG TPA: SWIM zinc finger family protein [Chloroflexota bacterium]|nr:SWIM zinc finger family protein [Chloroflexota bacterium]